MSDRPDVNEQLAKFGLNRIESVLYLYLLGKTPQTILQVTQNTRLPRTSVYDNIQKLAEKGLVTRSFKYKSQLFQAAPLEFFETLIDREKAKVENLQSTLSQLKSLSLSLSQSPTSTQVRYYHGSQGFQQMMWNTLSAENEMIGYSETGRVSVVGKKFITRWDDEVQKRRLKDRVIINPKPETFKYLRDIRQTHLHAHEVFRLLPQRHLYIAGDTTIYNNIFAVCYWKLGEVVGVEIENPELVKTQKSIFEVLWKQAKPLKISGKLPDMPGQ